MVLPPLLRWGLIFLHCPIPLSEDEKNGLAILAGEAYFSDTHCIPFDWDTCRGEVRATSQARIIGAFVGQEFEATVSVPRGEGVVRFLVAEKQLEALHGDGIPEA